jgi:hypothetical protein
MNPKGLISDSIAGAVRHALLAVFVFLAAKGWISKDQSMQLLEAAGAAGVIIALSLWNKYKLYEKLAKALGLPANSTWDDLALTMRR